MNCDALQNTAVKLQSKEIIENKIRNPFIKQLRCIKDLLS